MDLHRIYCLLVAVFMTVVFLLCLYGSQQRESTISAFLPPRLSIGQVHIALGSAPHSVNIAWVLKTQADTCYVSFGNSNLYSPDCTQLSYRQNTGSSYTSFVYNKTAFNLVPEHVYLYQIVCMIDSVTHTSATHNFKGPKRPTSPITFISLADWSTGPRSDPVDNYTDHPKPNIYPFLYQDVSQTDYDAILHAGDFAYDLNSFGGRMGDDYMKSIEPIVARVPYMTTTGNHESYTNFTHYRGLFKTPGYDTYYSFDLGSVHFVMLDSEAYVGRFHTDLQLQRHQEWLVADLANNKQPWVILVSHRPMYCNSNLKCKVCTNSCTIYALTMVKYLEELCREYKVALFISADVHLYERTRPIYQNKTAQAGDNVFINPPAPIYVVNGVAGNFDRDDGMTNVAEKMQPWGVKISQSLGYGRVTVFNSSHLRWEQLAIGNTQNDDMDWLKQQQPRVIDDFWIIKDRNA